MKTFFNFAKASGAIVLFALALVLASHKARAFDQSNFYFGTTAQVVTSGNPIPALSPNGSGQARFFQLSVGVAKHDPIVLPGQSVAGHWHWFWGNPAFATSNETDLTKIIANCSSANRGGAANCSGYWAPAVMDTKGTADEADDEVVPYSGIDANGKFSDPLFAYYKQAKRTVDYAFVQNPGVGVVVPPLAIGFVAGDSHNIQPYTTNQALNGTTPRAVYGCTLADGTKTYAQVPYIPPCAQGGTVNVFIKVPHCWDGQFDHATNNQSTHMAMTIGDDTCPATHPIVVSTPESYGYSFKVLSTQGTWNYRLSSDSIYDWTGYNAGRTSHIDWANGWPPEIHQAFTNHCLNERRDSSNALCDGRRLGLVAQ